MNNYVVYTHSHNNKVFYVGMGKPDRPYQYPEGRSESWLDYYYSVNKQIDVGIVSSGLSKEKALQKESELITYYGLQNLVNIQSGVTKVKSRIRHDDLVSLWIDDVGLEPDISKSVKPIERKELWTNFCKWAYDGNYRQITSKEFSKRLEVLKIPKRGGKPVKYYLQKIIQR